MFGLIALHVLEGAVRIGSLIQAHSVTRGSVLVLDRSTRHDVEAIEESVLLLTIALKASG